MIYSLIPPNWALQNILPTNGQKGFAKLAKYMKCLVLICSYLTCFGYLLWSWWLLLGKSNIFTDSIKNHYVFKLKTLHHVHVKYWIWSNSNSISLFLQLNQYSMYNGISMISIWNHGYRHSKLSVVFSTYLPCFPCLLFTQLFKQNLFFTLNYFTAMLCTLLKHLKYLRKNPPVLLLHCSWQNTWHGTMMSCQPIEMPNQASHHCLCSLNRLRYTVTVTFVCCDDSRLCYILMSREHWWRYYVLQHMLFMDSWTWLSWACKVFGSAKL